MKPSKIYALIDYEDEYVQPLLLKALQSRIPPELLVLIKDASELPSPESKFLQWRQYESIDFDRLMESSTSVLANSYVIRKALIRKHYLSTTVSHWLTKHPESVLKDHVKPSVEFEVDYAEFLDDALVEAYELKESWARNEVLGEDGESKEWWILKPGMSDRGQGIRLFSSEEELQAIFQEWDPPSDDEDEDAASHHGGSEEQNGTGNGVMASQLRHFIAQPYVHPPLILPPPHPSAGRKFHIRTYVLAVGALEVYVYKPMLALFAGKPYVGPSEEGAPKADLSSHLTNTCLQSGEREGSVHSFWQLPAAGPESTREDWKEDVFGQICSITGEVFEAAARSMSVHFQPLPNAFEVFGLDFMVDAKGKTWLLEVNAFPDFAQTGGELRSLIQGLFEETVDVGISPFFGIEHTTAAQGRGDMTQVLKIDLGRR
ncbi:TTL-domain-containing [Lecanosticta acicola]|uniref:TTL-domain-containing n=1 Tax=Lecanosticta acicola TaxID=111012 RepID=A0AAI9E953_9PEZI|nr:TTL-domain-containing [Lecanosticta acicola]